MRVGFIGLGSLGKEIAKRLLSQGVDILVWNRTKEKAKGLGCPMADSPADLIRQVDRVFVMVFDSAASEQVLFGKDGLVEGGVKGKTIIDMTTNHHNYVSWAYEEIEKEGGFYLDAPVLGSVIPARKGELIILVGGVRQKFEENTFLFEKFCKAILYVGKAGNATKLKLINNLVLGSFMVTLAEAVALGERAGFDRSLVLEVLEKGAGKSMLLDVKKDKLLREDFETHFSVDLIHKDLHYLEDLLYNVKGISFLASNVKNAYALAEILGFGHMDFSAVYKIFKLHATGD